MSIACPGGGSGGQLVRHPNDALQDRVGPEDFRLWGGGGVTLVGAGVYFELGLPFYRRWFQAPQKVGQRAGDSIAY